MTNGTSDNPTGNSAVANKRRGLGRGLGALIVDTQTTPPPAFESTDADNADSTDSSSVGNGTQADLSNLVQGNGVRELPLDQISPNPQQPRSHFDPAALEELAASIRTHGILQPLIVTGNPHHASHYWLVAGERRWRAARLALLETVPVIVREASPLQLVEWALVENVQRGGSQPSGGGGCLSDLGRGIHLNPSRNWATCGQKSRCGRQHVAFTPTPP